MKYFLILLTLLNSTVFANDEDNFYFGKGKYTLENIRERQRKAEEEERQKSWSYNPLSAYMSRDTYEKEILQPNILKGSQKQYGRGKVITIDTRNTKECYEIRDSLMLSANYETNKFDDLCINDNKNPYASVVVVENDYRVPLTLDNFSSENQELIRQTRNFLGVGAAAMGVLFMLPESVTKWDKEELAIQNIGSKWLENVKNGPVVDKDDWVINYIGHPLSGAAYYTVARHTGAGKMKSFGYSVLMSTFFWEYGLEAFAEKPSIQDLIITPLIGSLIGEGMYQIEKNIEENNGELLGSEKLGSIVMGVMNPAEGLLNVFNKPFESEFFKKSDFYFTMTPPKRSTETPNFQSEDKYYLGLEFELKF